MKKLKIGNKVWTVKLTDELNYKDDSWDYGKVIYKTQEILINKTSKKETWLETFLHEINHIFMQSFYSTKESIRSGKIDHELSCDLIGVGLASIINTKQFKDIIKWLYVKK